MSSQASPAANLRLLNTTAALGLITLIIYILHVGKSLLLPLIIALVVWYIIMQFAAFFHQLKIGRLQLPYALSLLISILFSGVILYAFILLLTSSIGDIIDQTPLYQEKLKAALAYVNSWTGNHLDSMKLFSKLNLSIIFSTLALVISNILSSFTLILIYLLFLLLEAKTFDAKLQGICKSQIQYHKVNNVLGHIHTDINAFLKAKVLINASAGVASYITLLCFHIDYAEFWGVLVFLLHFIPFIGPIVAVIFIMLAISVQISSLLLFLILSAILIAIQFAVGNLLEPKVMGTRLNLSPIVILISLAFWGYVWGIVGMFLCIPIMVIVNIIFANFPQTRAIAVMLSANWRPSQSE